MAMGEHMDDVGETARRYLAGLDRVERLACTPLTESLRTGRGAVVQAARDGVLLRLDYGDCFCYVLSARDGAAAKRLVCAQPDLPLPSDRAEGEDIVLLLDAAQASALAYEPPRDAIYHICVYEGCDSLPLRGSLDIRHLGTEDAAVVCAHYRLLDEEGVRRRLAAGWLWGGYDEHGELVGFIGEHDEASMGMLEVFPEHRRRGYGRELESFLINLQLSQGRVPYCHVAIGNEASLALQERLGLTLLPQLQCWCV